LGSDPVAVVQIVRWSLRQSPAVAAVFLAGTMLCASNNGALSDGCKPRRALPTIVLRNRGECDFNLDSLEYRGTPVEQAMCLMRGLDGMRDLSPRLESLPDALATRIGRDTGLPEREALSAFLSKQDLEWDFASHLWQPVSRAEDNNPEAPVARYFVIHDTSGPNFGHRSFPDDTDTTAKFNDLKNYYCGDGWGKAHVVVNRTGDMIVDHDFAIPWRETKFERAVDFVGTLKGLFLHVELIQPRRAAAGYGRYNDAQAPTPGFTTAQYDRLALLYTIASVRAGHWLVPAFHAAIDADIRDGHDDPRNFDIDSFANSIEILTEKLRGPEQVQASHP
jgi:hypothetical protein